MTSKSLEKVFSFCILLILLSVNIGQTPVITHSQKPLLTQNASQQSGISDEDLVLDNGHLRIVFDQNYKSYPWFFTYLTSYDYNVELCKNYDSTESSSYTGSQDRTESYVVSNVIYFDYVYYQNAQGYQIIQDRTTSQYSARWNTTVILPNGASYFLLFVEITNTDNEQIILDEITTHVHDGIQHCDNIKYKLGQGVYPSETCANDIMYVYGTGNIDMTGSTGWRNYALDSQYPYTRVYDPNTQEAVTIGMVYGTTGPNQVVIYYGGDSSVPPDYDYMVNEAFPNPGETVTHHSFIAIHDYLQEDSTNIYDNIKSNYTSSIGNKETFNLREVSFYNCTIQFGTGRYAFNYDLLGGTEIIVNEIVPKYNDNNSVFILSYDYINNIWKPQDTLNLNINTTLRYPITYDLDNDGQLEYIIKYNTGTGSNYNLGIFHKQGSMLYLVSNSIQFSDGIYDMDFFDVDDDGIMEIGLVTGYYDSSAYVYKWVDNQLVLNWTKYYGSCFLGSCKFIDINNDSQVEFVVSNALSQLEFYEWTGSTFSLMGSFAQDAARNMVCIDYDFDGVDELVACGWSEHNERNIYVYNWDGTSISQSIGAVMSNDVKNIERYFNTITKKWDLFTITTNGAYLMESNGSNFQTYESLAMTYINAPCITVSDIDNDARDEIIISDQDNINNPAEWMIITVLEYSSRTPLTDNTPPTIDIGHFHEHISEYDNATIWASIQDQSSLHEVILSYSLDGSLWTNCSMYMDESYWVQTIPPQSLGTTVYYKVYAIDVAGNQGVSQVNNFTIDSNPSWIDSTTAYELNGFKKYFFFDFDGTPGDELILSSPEENNGTFCIYKYNRYNHSWTILTTLTFEQVGQNFYIIPKDLDNDNRIEYITIYSELSASTTYLLICHRVGNLLVPISNRLTFSDHIYDVDFFDFDGDGILEIVIATAYFDSGVYVYSFDGSVLSSIWNVNFGSSFVASVRVGEIDGDSFPELICSHSAAGIDVYDWTGSTFTYKASISRTPTSSLLFIVDIDNDTQNEIVSTERGGDIIFIDEWTGTEFNSWSSSSGPTIYSFNVFYNQFSQEYELILCRSDGIFITHWNGSGFSVLSAVELQLNVSSVYGANSIGDIDYDNCYEVVFKLRNSLNSSLFDYLVVQINWRLHAIDIVGPHIATSHRPAVPKDIDDVQVSAEITDPSGVSSAILSYSLDGGTSWTNITMTFSIGNYTATIPQQSAGTIVMYKVYSNDTNGNWGVSSITQYTVDNSQGPSINTSHSPSNPTLNDTVTVSAEISDPDDVSQAILSYSTDGGSSWTNVSMTHNTNWTADIPAQPIGTTVHYKVYAEDGIGNWAVSSITNYTVNDTTSPNIITSRNPINPTSADSVIVYADVNDTSSISQVILSYSVDGGSSWTNLSMSYSGNWTATIPSQSSGTVVQYKVYAEDVAGNWGTSETEQYAVDDTQPPTINVMREQSEPTNLDTVRIVANITDNSGIDTAVLSYSTDGGTTWINITMIHIENDNYEEYIPQQGIDTLVFYRVYSNDTYGNWNVSVTFNYTVRDGEGPTLTIIHTPINPDDTMSVVVNVSATDPSGVNQVILSYSLDGGVSWTNVSMTLNVNWTAEISPNSAGTNVTYKIYAEDNEGNWAVSSLYYYLIVDNTPPTIENIAYEPVVPNDHEPVTILVNATDTSGISQAILSYSIDGGASWANITMILNASWTADIPTQSAGVQVLFKIYMEDNIGLWSISAIYNYTVTFVDATPPTINIRIDPDSPTSDDLVLVQANVFDAEGINSVILSYSVDGGATWTNVSMTDLGNGTYTGLLPMQADGTTVYFRVYALDLNGNWAISETKSYIVDDTEPEIELIWTVAEYGDRGLVTVIVNITDDSEMSFVALFYTTNNWTSYQVINYTESRSSYTWTFWILNNQTILVKIVAKETTGKSKLLEDGPITYGDFETPLIEATFNEFIFIDEPYCVFLITDNTKVTNVTILYSFDSIHWNHASVLFNGTYYIAEIENGQVGVAVKILVTASDVYGNIKNFGPVEVVIGEHILPEIEYLFYIPEPVYANETIRPFIRAEDDSKLLEVYILYSVDLTQWTRIDLVYNGSLYTAEIPGQDAGTYVYFIGIAVDIYGNENRTEMITVYVQEGQPPGNIDLNGMTYNLLSIGITSVSLIIIIYFLRKILQARKATQWTSQVSNP